MKPLNEYPVTFAYKAQDGKYYGTNGSVGLYHRGEDRKAPLGTPIIVQGVTIGEVGKSGLASGYHCHFQCMVGGNDVSPVPYRFTGGKVVRADFHTQFGYHVRIQHADGTIMIYAHLSKINVSVGQVIKLSTGDTMNQEAGTELYRTALFREPESVAGASQWNGQTPAHALRAVRGAEWQSVKARLEAYPKLEQAIRDLETALANEKNKPPQVVEKIVEKIVTKNVEIIKEIERIVEIEPSWVVKVRDFIKAFLKLK